MKIGKLSNETLEKIVISNLKNKRDEIIVGAEIGEDNGIIDFGEEACIISTDPITGATKDIGHLAVHVSCNDVAASGGEPIAVLLTIMAPVGSKVEEIKGIMKDADRAAKEANIQIIGGHTEITDAVNRIVVSTTVVGKQKKSKLLKKENIQVGDKILITKVAGIEGTSILAKERESRLKGKLTDREIEYAKSMDKDLSVITEGRICGELGVHYMHDITEGGVLGAFWEGAQAMGKGVEIDESLIPIENVTLKLCEILEIDPFRLISSGSMLVISPEDKIEEIEKALGEKGIRITTIGEVTDSDAILIKNNGEREEINSPGSDELYKALG